MARYEAAYWNTARSYLPGFLQSAREDISALPRQEVMRRLRYFEKNSPVLLKILDLYETNVVGDGITPAPQTADEKWNKKAADWWLRWSETTADTTGENDVGGLQKIALRAELVDGDHFALRRRGQRGRPVLEMAEAHRCGTGTNPIENLEARGLKLCDGVVVDKATLRAMSYLISQEFDTGTADLIAASDLVQFFRKRRAGQYRGISLYHAAILALHDSDDLQKFEMGAAKDAASISKIIQTAAGMTTTDGFGLGASIQNQPTAGSNVDRLTYYRQVLGAETIMTKPGDKFEQFMSERPSAAMTGFWDKLDEKIVYASGVSYAALVDYKGNWGGATLRAAVSSDNKRYNLETRRISRKWQRVWNWAIGFAMQSGELEKNPDFQNVRWHPPKRTTVDVGNDSAAMIEELKAGLRTYEDIYGEIGEDWKDRLAQRADEEKYIDELAEERGIDRQFIASFAQERLAGNAPDAIGPTDPVTGQPVPQNQPTAPKNSKKAKSK